MPHRSCGTHCHPSARVWLSFPPSTRSSSKPFKSELARPAPCREPSTSPMHNSWSTRSARLSGSKSPTGRATRLTRSRVGRGGVQPVRRTLAFSRLSSALRNTQVNTVGGYPLCSCIASLRDNMGFAAGYPTSIGGPSLSRRRRVGTQVVPVSLRRLRLAHERFPLFQIRPDFGAATYVLRCLIALDRFIPPHRTHHSPPSDSLQRARSLPLSASPPLRLSASRMIVENRHCPAGVPDASQLVVP